jgi:hypothetical protein
MEEMNSNIIYLLYYKNFSGCHNLPSLSTVKKKDDECNAKSKEKEERHLPVVGQGI